MSRRCLLDLPWSRVRLGGRDEVQHLHEMDRKKGQTGGPKGGRHCLRPIRMFGPVKCLPLTDPTNVHDFTHPTAAGHKATPPAW